MAAPCGSTVEINPSVFTCAQDVCGNRTTCTSVNLASWKGKERKTVFLTGNITRWGHLWVYSSCSSLMGLHYGFYMGLILVG